MFLPNKYTNTYYNIINRSKSIDKPGYTELHHIIPKSLGGSDDSDNLVKLTAKEHYIAHRLLCKMTTSADRGKMSYAFHMMSLSNKNQKRYAKKLTAASYKILKEELSIFISKSQKGVKTGKQKASRKPRGPMSEETKLKMSEKRKQLWQSKEYREKNTRTGYSHSEETKLKMSEKRKGKPSTTKGRKYTEDQRIARSVLSAKIMADPNVRLKISNTKKSKLVL